MIATRLGIGSHWLDAPAAASYLRMRADGCPPGITSAGRTPERQIEIFLERYTTDYARSSKRDRRTWRGKTYWRLPGVASAATPGTSNHEHGTALDLSEPARSWVRTHGRAYGWIADCVSGEPWHFEYRPTAEQKEQDMATAAEIWGTPVTRGGQKISALQELADTKTLAMATATKIDAILAALAKMQGVNIDMDALAAKVADHVGDALADDVADELGKRLGG